MALGGFVVLQRLSTVLRHFVASPAPTSSASARETGGGFGGDAPGRIWAISERDRRDDAYMLVRRVLEEEAEKHATTPEPFRPDAVYDPPTEGDLAEAIDILFQAPRLAAIAEGMRARARASAAEALAELEAEAHRSFLFAKHAADSEADDEAVILAILRLA